MEMEVARIIVAGGVPVGLAIVGYLVMALKALNATNKEIAMALSDYKLEVAEKYVLRTEMAAFRQEMRSMEERLDKRFDKMEEWMGRRFDMVLGRIPSDGK